MAEELARGDAIREYLTGAASDGGAQADPLLSLGLYRSSTRALSLGMTVSRPVFGVKLTHAGGGNPEGVGLLQCTGRNTLRWKPYGAAAYGPAVTFSATGSKVLEASGQPGQFLLVHGTLPFANGESQVRLYADAFNVWGFRDVAHASATAGISEYRATILKNVSAGTVTSWKRWIGKLGTDAVSGVAQLGGAGSGTIQTAGTFADWPSAGWCQVRQSGGTLREVVYYTSRTSTVLTVPAAGRGLLGTSAGAGANTDVVSAVPGIAVALDPAGVTSADDIQVIANENTAPAGVTWNLGITEAGGLSVATMTTGQQQGLWFRRHVPAGCKATPASLARLIDKWTV